MGPATRWLLIAAVAGCDVTSLLGSAPAEVDQLGTADAHHDRATLIVARPTDAIRLEPGRASDNESIEVMEQVFDKLVQFRPGTNEIEPGLAASWTTSERGRVWTFQLREGVRFHDGTPLDADAVVFSFERQRDPRHPYHRPDFADWRNNFSYIQSVEKLSEHTVRITIERMYAPFLSYLAMTAVAIVSPTAVRERGDEFARRPVGTGPFKLVDWRQGRIVLERNDAYWGDAAALERLIFESIPDPRQRMVALESGAIDIAYGVPPGEVQFLSLHPGLRVHTTAADNVSFVAINTLRRPFDDVRVRRALNFAVNVEPIVKLAFEGMALPAEGPLPPTQWAYHKLATPYTYHPETARALLENARLDGAFDPGRTYTLYMSPTPRPYLPHPEQVARAIQANLRAVGVKTRLVSLGFDELIRAGRNGDHDLLLLGWVPDAADPDNYLYVMFSRESAERGHANNMAFFLDDEVQGLLVHARELEDRADRKERYARVQQRVSDQAPWVPLAHSRIVIAARADVAGTRINPSGHVSYRVLRRAAPGEVVPALAPDDAGLPADRADP